MTLTQAILLFLTGATASGINAVAGGGSLISFPILTVRLFGIGFPELIANATNSVGLWPGSLGGGIGFRNLFDKAGRYLKTLMLPTILGSLTGAFLLLHTSNQTFKQIIPWLILLASVMLILQPKVKKMVGRSSHLPVWVGWLLQYLVSTYGGYFGAGMGIMMLACFALYMEGNVHELNAVKNWLGLIVNFTCSGLFFFGKPSASDVATVSHKMVGLVVVFPALALVCGAIVGGFTAAKVSQKFNPDKLRAVIGCYGFAMSAFFFNNAYFTH